MNEFMPPWYHQIDRFFDIFQEEYESSTYLSKDGKESLSKYYQKLSDISGNPWARLALIRAKSRRMSPVLNLIDQAGRPLRILDAGCGVGTQAILFACQGADVIGVDINTERLAVAAQRADFYEEKGLLAGSVKFELKNIFSMLEQRSKDFDLVWASEAISHIDPIQKFLDLTYAALKPGGRIVISDPNILNPWVWFKLFRRRGFRFYTEKEDPETGEMISYAQERCFSMGQIAAKLASAGFWVDDIIPGSFIPGFLRQSRFYLPMLRIEKFLREMPIISRLSGGYTVVGVRRLDVRG